MNGITELAMLFKSRENPSGYSPMFGKIVSLPTLKIQIGNKIIIDDSFVKSTIDLYTQDSYGNYININKTVVLLPYADNQKFIVIGVVI